MPELLEVDIIPHREFIPASQDQQRLFVMLKLRSAQEVNTATSSPATNFVFVIDTSGSMREVVAGDSHQTGNTFTEDGKVYNEVVGGKTKIDMVIDSLNNLLKSGQLTQNDLVAIVQFDDSASVLIDLTPATQVQKIEGAIAQLRDFSGGTRMGRGLKHALNLLSTGDMGTKRTLVFTDGETFDEDACLELAQDFRLTNIPVTALGFGDDFNEDLLFKLSNPSGGTTMHVVAGQAAGTQIGIVQLPETILSVFSQAQQEVITNLGLTLKTVKGVELVKILRAYPTQSEFPLESDPYLIGNVAVNDETVFILEFNMGSRDTSRVRIAQLGLTYDVPGKNMRGELPPQNLVVQFVEGQGGAAQVDQEVMHYVQQCNIAQIVNQATVVVEQDPAKAQELLENARRMTVRLGNQDMTASLDQAQDELRKTKKISAGTRKTVKIGSRGKTVKMSGEDLNGSLSNEQIRKLTGT